jgi:lysophospholipase L1-like esterase
MKIFRYVIFAVVLLIQCKTTEPPFLNDIIKFRQSDASGKPANDMVLFIGSSSFTYWKDVQTDLNNPNILNRGFGGSTLLDVWRYKDDIIFTYKPKQIVIYCGENDLAYSEKVSSKDVLKRFQKLYKSIRKQYPAISLVYISLKPSPARWKMRNRVLEANRLISAFLATEKNTIFVNIWDKMMNENGYPKSEIFTADSLHMNKLGYNIWVNELKGVLFK